MSRLLAVTAFVVLVPTIAAQEPKVGTLPPGPRGGPVEVVHALLLQAQVIENDEIMFLFPRGDQEPALFTKVDGKDVKAVGTDLKPLAPAELRKRLAGYTPVVVVQAEFELPDPFFVKALNEKTVIFALAKDKFAPMAKASAVRRRPGEIPP
jgi:hypothetical protein